MNLFTFNRGDLIVSSQINANFQEFARILGQNSSAAELALPGRLTFGPTRRASISALSDKVVGGSKYLHVGWNAEEYIDGTVVGVQRRVEQSPSSVLRIGDTGLEFLYSRSDQNVRTISKVFSVEGSGNAFLHGDWSFTTQTNPASIADYRLTFNPLDQAVVLNTVTRVAANTTTLVDLSRFSTNFKTTNFHGVEVVVTATAGTASTQVSVYGQELSPYSGVLLTLGSSQQGSERGCAVLKRGVTKNQTLVIKNTAALTALTVNVIGIWK